MSAALTLGDLTLRRSHRRLRHSVGGAGHRTTVRDVLELDLGATHAGRTLLGRGEAAPLPGYSLDELSEAEHALHRFRANHPATLPLDGDLVDAIAELARPLPPSARAALECALLDLAGQALDRPMWSLLGGSAPLPLPLAAVLSGPDDTLGFESAQLLSDGFRTQKRKLGGEDTLASLIALRPVADGERSLRLDANRSLSAEAFRALAPALTALRPVLLEEPVNADLAAWLLAEPLGELRIGVDESLAARTTQGALAALQRFAPAVTAGRVGAIIVKPARDGLLGALALARAARRLAVPVIVTHLWDGPRGHLAAVQLAIALGTSATPAQGLALHAGLEGEEPTAALEALRALVIRGALQVPRRAGLGLAESR